MFLEKRENWRKTKINEISRAVSSTVPVTAVPGTIQVLLYLKKYLVLLTRYFVPYTDPQVQGTMYLG